MRRILALSSLLILILILTLQNPSQALPDPRVAPAVWRQLDARGQVDVLLRFSQPDLSPAASLPTKTARGQWVYAVLRAAALREQGPVIAQLTRMGLPYQRFWVVNAIQVRITREQLAQLLTFPQIQRVSPNQPFRLEMPSPRPGVTAAGLQGPLPWGLQRVHADWAWEQGIWGQGVVVAGQDTGYDWEHEALKRAYRGYDAATDTVSHDYNWHDAIHAIDPHNSGENPCGVNAPAPCDDHGHGTHTMGTMVGNDLDPTATDWPAAAPHPIGIAPAAQWMACRNMERGWGQPSTYIECFQWFTAPWPIGGDPMTDGDPSRAPDIINNSWSCPPSEGCTPDNLEAIEPALQAATAAGILVVVSAGNGGSACGTIQNPPAIYPDAFSVAATQSGDGLANFSSRGPVTYQDQTRIGPDISAPGVAVFSSYPGNGYTSLSGTSMAGPHVAGVAALLLSAYPQLKGHPEQLRDILTSTADVRYSTQGCGDDTPTSRPNNGYGWGIVNAQAAIQSRAYAYFAPLIYMTQPAR